MTIDSARASILLCAATRWEVGPLDGLRRPPVRLLKTGVGPVRAAAALARLEGPSPAWVLSTGLAGALQPGMSAGDIVADVQGLEAGLPAAAREAARDCGLAVHFGRIAHSDVVVADPAAKLALGARLRASAVDMESAALRAWAEDRGARFLAVRAVLDAVHEPLIDDLPEGEDAAALWRFAWKHRARLPLLARSGLLQRRAMRSLARFLAAFLPRLP